MGKGQRFDGMSVTLLTLLLLRSNPALSIYLYPVTFSSSPKLYSILYLPQIQY